MPGIITKQNSSKKKKNCGAEWQVDRFMERI